MNEINELRASIGVSQSQFAEHFGIPVKSIQNWEIEKSHPPKYVPNLIRRIIEYEKRYKPKNGGE